MLRYDETTKLGVRPHNRGLLACFWVAVWTVGLLLLVAPPAAHGARSAARAVPVHESPPVELTAKVVGPRIAVEPSPVAYTGGGFVTAATDSAGDVLLFVQSNGADSWIRSVLYKAGRTMGMSDPTVAANPANGSVAVIAAQAGTGYLYSWTGQVGGTFTQSVVADDQAYDYDPSVAYSATGNNFVLTDIDSSNNIDYWYSTTNAGGWVQQDAVPADGGQPWTQAVITTTDKGVVIAATDGSSEAPVQVTYYQPFFGSTWTYTGGVNLNESGLSIVWTGTEVLLAAAQTNSGGAQFLALSTISDTGSYISAHPYLLSRAVFPKPASASIQTTRADPCRAAASSDRSAARTSARPTNASMRR
jgi:hypothetical protein